MTAWQQMKTAPTDGTRVLVCQIHAFRTHGERVRFARYKDGKWASTDPVGALWDARTLLAWQPVPEPPRMKFSNSTDNGARR